MRRGWFLPTLCLPLVHAACAPKPTSTIEVADEVLCEARQAWFDYHGVLSRAEAGDKRAIIKLIDFSRHTDAASALCHSVVLRKLLFKVGDERFALAAADCTPDVKRLLVQMLDCGDAYIHPPPDRPRPELSPETARVLQVTSLVTPTAGPEGQ
jgi:hypothetical protein